MVITPEKFMMIRWEEYFDKAVTDTQTDGRTDGPTDGRPEIYLELLGRSQNLEYSPNLKVNRNKLQKTTIL